MAASEVLQRLRRPRLRFGDDVPPDRSVVERHLRLDRLVGVDGVAEVDEDVGLQLPHRFVEPHAAARQIDAPSLPDAVAGKHERHIARRWCRAPTSAATRRDNPRRCLEASRHRLAEAPQIGEILKLRAIGNALPGRQLHEVDARGEVRGFERRRADDPARIGERRSRRVLDDQASRPIRSAPDDRLAVGDVAGGDAARHPGARVLDDDRRQRGRRARQLSAVKNSRLFMGARGARVGAAWGGWGQRGGLLHPDNIMRLTLTTRGLAKRVGTSWEHSHSEARRRSPRRRYGEIAGLPTCPTCLPCPTRPRGPTCPTCPTRPTRPVRTCT